MTATSRGVLVVAAAAVAAWWATRPRPAPLVPMALIHHPIVSTVLAENRAVDPLHQDTTRL